MFTDILVFDKQNKQDDFQYMAKVLETGEYKVGYIVVEKPWYSAESDWIYYLYNNKYGGGFCGGSTDLGLERYIVDKETIEPYTQTAQIKLNQIRGYISKVVKRYDPFGKEDVVCVVSPTDEIPYKLWKVNK